MICSFTALTVASSAGVNLSFISAQPVGSAFSQSSSTLLQKTISSVVKFIPSTGVTLPLVSYGGSSVFSTLIMFAIIQGLYIMKHDERHSDEKRNIRKKAQKTEKTAE